MKQAFFLTFLLLGSILCAQPNAVQKTVVDGKKYYVHIVESGQTLFSLEKLYGVDKDEIIKCNPGSEKTLSKGQKLNIPVPVMTVNHTVAAKETIYAISKRYGVTAEAIIKANPGSDKGIQIGQKLVIPNVEREIALQTPTVEKTVTSPIEPEATDKTVEAVTEIPVRVPELTKDTVIIHKVGPKETLYTLSKRYMVTVEEIKKLNDLSTSTIQPGSQLKIKVRKEVGGEVPIRNVPEDNVRKVDSAILFPSKSNYKVAMLLPYFLDKGEGHSDYISKLATEFYMGAKMAMDTLESMGLRAEFFTYDTRNDTLTLKKVLAKSEMKEMDLIIGPFFANMAPTLARYCQKHAIRMVCPVSMQTDILLNNPYVHLSVPSDARLMERMAQFILDQHAAGALNILIKSPTPKDELLYNFFKEGYMNATISGSRPKLIETTPSEFTSYMKKGVKINVIYPTNELKNALQFTNKFNAVSDKYDEQNIRIFGTKDWLAFDEIRGQFKNKYNFHFASPNDLNYKNERTENLLRRYRIAYNADMTKMSVQGFDVVLGFCSEMLLSEKQGRLIMNQFEMKQVDAGCGYENQKTYVLEVEDYELIEVGGK
jgi:LysM repeat protein